MYKGGFPSREAIAIKRAKPESLEVALEFNTEIELSFKYPLHLIKKKAKKKQKIRKK